MNNEKITIIDDDVEVRQTLEGIFHAYGFDVTSYSDPREAVEASEDDEKTCILLDFDMPEMDGLAVQKALTQKGIYTPVIVYTGKVGVEEAVQSMNAGAFTLIQKPAPNHVLVNKVREAVTQANLCRPREHKIRSAQSKLAKLSEREKQIALLVAEGKKSGEIASQLFISKRTVDIHRSHIFEKLDIKSIANLIQIVLYAGMQN